MYVYVYVHEHKHKRVSRHVYDRRASPEKLPPRGKHVYSPDHGQAVNVQAIGEGASKESIDNVRRRALERELAMMSRATSQSKPEPGGGSKQEIQPLEAGGAIDSSYILEISSRYTLHS